MYENMTADVILAQMLGEVPDSLDKREGTFIYNALAPVAVKLSEMYTNLDMCLDEAFADTASFNSLKRIAAERGVKHLEATNTVIAAKIELPEGAELLLGDRFFIGDIFFAWNGNMSDNGEEYILECEIKGVIDDVVGKHLVYDGTNAVVSSAVVTNILIYGRNEETQEELRRRYYDSIENAPFAGNRAAYREIIMGVPGVGGCRVFRQNVGELYFYIYIINQNSEPVTDDDLLAAVQTAVDAVAPIGHNPKVLSANKEDFSVYFTLTVKQGTDAAYVNSEAMRITAEYFKQLAAEWGTSYEKIVFRSGELTKLLFDIAGVTDVSNDEALSLYTFDDESTVPYFDKEESIFTVKTEVLQNENS